MNEEGEVGLNPNPRFSAAFTRGLLSRNHEHQHNADDLQNHAEQERGIKRSREMR